MRTIETRALGRWCTILLVVAGCGDSSPAQDGTIIDAAASVNDGPAHDAPAGQTDGPIIDASAGGNDGQVRDAPADGDESDGQAIDAAAGGNAGSSGGAAGMAGAAGGGTNGAGGVAVVDAGPDGAVIDAQTTPDAAIGPLTIFAGAGKPTGIALGATAVYWADEEKGAIFTCPKTGCGAGAPVVVATIPSPRGIALHGSTLFMVSLGQAEPPVPASVKKCTLGACAPDQMIDLGPAQSGGPFGNVGIAADDQYVYVVGGPRAVRCPLAGCGNGGLGYLGDYRGPILGIAVDATTAYLGRALRGVDVCPLAGCSTPQDETTPVPANSAMAVAIDATNVYWSEHWVWAAYNSTLTPVDGAIRVCPRAGCAVASAKVLAAGAIGPYAIAVDETSLYYTDRRNGRVERTPKDDFAHSCGATHLASCNGCNGYLTCDGTCSTSCADAGAK